MSCRLTRMPATNVARVMYPKVFAVFILFPPAQECSTPNAKLPASLASDVQQLDETIFRKARFLSSDLTNCTAAHVSIFNQCGSPVITNYGCESCRHGQRLFDECCNTLQVCFQLVDQFAGK